MIQAIEEIKNLVKIHSKYNNNESLKGEIYALLLKNSLFYDILVISIDNLLDDDSKLVFKFFSRIHRKKVSTTIYAIFTESLSIYG